MPELKETSKFVRWIQSWLDTSGSDWISLESGGIRTRRSVKFLHNREALKESARREVSSLVTADQKRPHGRLGFLFPKHSSRDTSAHADIEPTIPSDDRRYLTWFASAFKAEANDHIRRYTRHGSLDRIFWKITSNLADRVRGRNK